MTEDEVLALLGPLIGSKLTRYLIADSPGPTGNLTRVGCVLATGEFISRQDTDAVWLAWLVGTLDGIPGNGAPITAIRDGRFPEVLASARRYATDPQAP